MLLTRLIFFNPNSVFTSQFYVFSMISKILLTRVQIETRNNNLEMQSVNNKALIEELDKLLERLRVPSEVLSPIGLLV